MDDVRSWVGRSTRSVRRLDPLQADLMNATLDRPPGFGDGDVLPPAWHWLYFPEAVRSGELGPEGHPRPGLTMPPVGLPRRMWAGGRLSFDTPLRLGETVERVSTIRAVTPKRGRSGPLCFVTVEHDLRCDGVRRVLEEQTIVYREFSAAPPAAGDPPAAGAPPAPSDAADSSVTWTLDTTILFRYSALTFNGHRIHYDVDYCRQVEGYPNLVVHGPLLATLLLDLATADAGPPRTFAYRALSPAFLPAPVTVAGRRETTGTGRWWATSGGRLAMEATT